MDKNRKLPFLPLVMLMLKNRRGWDKAFPPGGPRPAVHPWS